MSDKIKIKNDYYIWDKGDNLWINNWFKTAEFECKCSNKECVEQKIAVELVNRLTEIREYTKSPMRITSGYRCSKHQEEIRNSGTSTVVAKKSTHELGNAADISVSSLTTLNLLLVAEKKFKSIGIANNFLHVDLRDDKVRRWKY
jgi:uncharacterized protein YcbK (DUF882 family)